jgi:hypothetical protein
VNEVRGGLGARPNASEGAGPILAAFGEWSPTEGSNSWLSSDAWTAAVTSPSLRRRTSHRLRVTGDLQNVFFDFNVYPFMSPPGSLAKRSSSVAALDSALCKISQLHR